MTVGNKKAKKNNNSQKKGTPRLEKNRGKRPFLLGLKIIEVSNRKEKKWQIGKILSLGVK
jgi:hypothetical protein